MPFMARWMTMCMLLWVILDSPTIQWYVTVCMSVCVHVFACCMSSSSNCTCAHVSVCGMSSYSHCTFGNSYVNGST